LLDSAITAIIYPHAIYNAVKFLSPFHQNSKTSQNKIQVETMTLQLN